MAKSATSTESAPDDLRADAEAAMRWEHSLPTRQALKVYHKAVWRTVAMSLTIIMEGYDPKLVGSLTNCR